MLCMNSSLNHLNLKTTAFTVWVVEKFAPFSFFLTAPSSMTPVSSSILNIFFSFFITPRDRCGHIFLCISKILLGVQRDEVFYCPSPQVCLADFIMNTIVIGLCLRLVLGKCGQMILLTGMCVCMHVSVEVAASCLTAFTCKLPLHTLWRFSLDRSFL